MFESSVTEGVISAVESHIPIESLQRDGLVHENIDALKACSTANKDQLPQALTAAEQLLGSLQKLDGGPNSGMFKQDLASINQGVNPFKNHADQYLPFLTVKGVNSQGAIQVLDAADGKVESLTIDHNLLTPTAPLDQGKSDQLYIGNGKDQSKTWKEAIQPGDVQQGRLGDCYFLASLQTVAQKDPEAIANMIHENGQGADGRHTYTVTFPGAKNQPITVDQPNVYEDSVTAQNASGLWTNVLELAHREITGKNMHDNGGYPTDALELLTGRQAVQSKIDQMKGDTLKDILNISNDSNILATACTAKTTTVTDASGNTVDIEAPHAYSIVGYDEKHGLVTVSNPQGLNGVEAMKHPEPGNVHLPNRFDGLLNKSEPDVANLPATGRLITMKMADFARAFDTVQLVNLDGKPYQPEVETDSSS